MRERDKLILIVVVFLAIFYLPLGHSRVQVAILESLFMLQDYAREHVLACLIPAFFIAGAISVFISQAAVLKYFGAGANKFLSYGVASVSGSVLAVCSCTVLPVFAGIYTRGAGIGPAAAFLYSGPAINILAVILTARVLGPDLGIARAIGAVIFAVAIGLMMQLIFHKEEGEKENSLMLPETDNNGKPWGYQGIFFAVLILILVFAAWGKPAEPTGIASKIYALHWYLTALLIVLLGLIIKLWFEKDELTTWIDATWGFAKQILPLLLAGVLAAGFLLGRPGFGAGLIPGDFVAGLVGGNSLGANFLASILGSLMYFATLTEVPIVQGLLGSGMGKGPALSLLLAGPAISLPSVIIIGSIMGARKTLCYIALVVIMSTFSGYLFGLWFG